MKSASRVLAAALGTLVLSQVSWSQIFTVDFESLTSGTTYGSGVNAPGDVIFTEDGIPVSVETDTSGSFNFATVDGFAAIAFPTTSMTLSNINLNFDVTGLGAPAERVTFEYVDFGGNEDLGVNGTVLNLNLLSGAPASIGGVAVSVTESPTSGGVGGMVTLDGPINSVTIGGQEFGMDNFVVTVPESSSVLMTVLAAATVLVRRRS